VVGLFLTDTAVGTEDAGRREFAEFVADHVFGDINGDEGLAVMDCEVMADEIRSDHRLAAPCFDGLALGSGVGDGVDLSEKLLINVWAFLE
jgi:hypothetical protein